MDWSPMKFRQSMRDMRLREMELAEQNPFLAQALETEKMEGHRIAVIARTVAMLIIACMLPFLNPNIH
ncbi:MAG: adenylate/guanylate cyclase domain-containing protein, partial [Pseudomonadota bacterium]